MYRSIILAFCFGAASAVPADSKGAGLNAGESVQRVHGRAELYADDNAAKYRRAELYDNLHMAGKERRAELYNELDDGSSKERRAELYSDFNGETKERRAELYKVFREGEEHRSG